MKRRVLTLAVAAALLLVPLMGAKGCSSAAVRRVNGPGGYSAGYPVRSGGLVYWIGNPPPKPLVGTIWKPVGYTKRNHHPIWLRVPK